MSLTSFAGDGANATDQALCGGVCGMVLKRWYSPATHPLQNPGNTSRMLSALARTRRCLKPHTPGSGSLGQIDCISLGLDEFHDFLTVEWTLKVGFSHHWTYLRILSCFLRTHQRVAVSSRNSKCCVQLRACEASLLRDVLYMFPFWLHAPMWAP